MIYYKFLRLEPIYYFCEIDYVFKTEQWKDVKGYEGIYMISDLGRTKSIDRNVSHKKGYLHLKSKMLKPSCGGNGYPSVNFWIKKRYKTYLVHRLVALHFIPNPESKKFINHKNANKKDCYILNLEWCTHKENMKHAKEKGLMRVNPNYGAKHHNSFAVSQYSIDNILIKEFETLTEAGKETGICRKKISRLCNGIKSKNQKFIWKFKQ